MDEQPSVGRRIGRFLTARGLVWLLLGLIGGGIAADMWERRRARELEKAHEEQQLALQSRLSQAELSLKELREQLEAERRLRHSYEDLVGRGRK